MWAKFIKQIAEEQQAGLKSLIEQINSHEERSQRRYERMHITNRKVYGKKKATQASE